MFSQTLKLAQRRWLLLILAAGLLSTAGCNKMISNYHLKKANQRAQEALENEADGLVGDLYRQTQASISKAQNEFNQQQFKAAKSSAKAASEQSKELLQKAKEARATSLKAEAFKWIKIAEQNRANQIDAAKYAQISEANTQGNQLMEKLKYDKSIPILAGVVSDVKFLLGPLEEEAGRDLEETRVMLEELRVEGAEVYATDYVTQMNELIGQIDSMINADINYRHAISTYERARQVRDEGIQETKKAKCNEMLTAIENLLNQATELGAPIYASQSFSEVSKEFEDLLTKFYESRYDTVLTAGPNLKPKVEDLIIETKREVARARRNDVHKALTDLVEGHVRDYLPGRAEQIQERLTEADRLFDEEKYTESKEVSLDGLELKDRIVTEFATYTENEIRIASEKLGTANGVFERMEAIFDQPIPGDWTGDDLALENSKQALKEELNSSLNNASLSLGVSELKAGEQDFHVSICAARQVAKDAEVVTQQTYRVVAHNAILELANQLTRYERDGGRQYASAEVDKTHTMLDESKALLADAKYREAVRRTADTKAQIEILAQELERVAVAKIESAREAVKAAKSNYADTYESGDVSMAMIQLDIAKDSLGGEGLLKSITSAESATDIARSAENRAIGKWLQDQMAVADEYLARAASAGAEIYAPDQLQNANDLRVKLGSLYESESYDEAMETAEYAVEASRQAFYAEINDAESAIAKAKQFDGWKYESHRLAEAIAQAKHAREKLEGGEFTAARQYAVQAITTANNVTVDAKRAAFEERVESLTQNMEHAQRDGAGYYQVDDLSRILGEMNRLQSEFDPASYEDYAEKVELLEAQLAGLMELTPGVLRELVLNMQDQLDKLEERGARDADPDLVDKVIQKIKYAQLDYQNEKYRPSFMNAKEAQKGLNDVRALLDERDYDRELSVQLNKFNEEIESFGSVLNMGSPAMVRLVIGPNGRAEARAFLSASSPSHLRSAINEIGMRVRDLQPPPSRVEVQRSAMEMLAVAKTSSLNFEKILIMDQYTADEAREIIQAAYHQMRDARNQQQRLTRSIDNPLIEIKPKAVEHVVSYQNF